MKSLYCEDGWGVVHAMSPIGGGDHTFCSMVEEGECEERGYDWDGTDPTILRPTKATAITCEGCIAVVDAARQVKVAKGVKGRR